MLLFVVIFYNRKEVKSKKTEDSNRMMISIIKKEPQFRSIFVRAPSPCQTWLPAAETTLWSSFYALSLSFVVLPL
jgi:hypothetical protein